MKKKIIFLLSITVISIGALTVCNDKTNVNADSYLGVKEDSRTFMKFEQLNASDDNVKLNIRDFTGQWSFLELTLEKENNIVIEDNSKSSSGELYMVILDNNYNIVSKKEVNGEGNMKFTPKEDGKYFVRLVGKNASGCFDIKIDADKKYESSFKGKFDDRGSLYNSIEKWS